MTDAQRPRSATLGGSPGWPRLFRGSSHQEQITTNEPTSPLGDHSPVIPRCAMASRIRTRWPET
jgi:hypothetical protein